MSDEKLLARVFLGLILGMFGMAFLPVNVMLMIAGPLLVVILVSLIGFLVWVAFFDG